VASKNQCKHFKLKKNPKTLWKNPKIHENWLGLNPVLAKKCRIRETEVHTLVQLLAKRHPEII
jgi:hypothetical protein